MIIQHNVPALNAHRYLGVNSKTVSSNLEKLSSGFRINRAADDAAGLAISEKMRGQIRGLSMAEQNVGQGVNLIQTAEGALDETHAILQRMRELAVQSSNGTYQDEDRIQITKEYEALKSEIDRIAESTHYNNIKLLDGSLGGATASSIPTIIGKDTTQEVLAASASTTTMDNSAAMSLTAGIAHESKALEANFKLGAGTPGVYTLIGSAADTFKLDSGETLTIEYTNKDGDDKTLTLKATAAITDTAVLASNINGTTPTDVMVSGDLQDFIDSFTAAEATNDLTFTSKTPLGPAKIISVSSDSGNATTYADALSKPEEQTFSINYTDENGELKNTTFRNTGAAVTNITEMLALFTTAASTDEDLAAFLELFSVAADSNDLKFTAKTTNVNLSVISTSAKGAAEATTDAIASAKDGGAFQINYVDAEGNNQTYTLINTDTNPISATADVLTAIDNDTSDAAMKFKETFSYAVDATDANDIVFTAVNPGANSKILSTKTEGVAGVISTTEGKDAVIAPLDPTEGSVVDASSSVYTTDGTGLTKGQTISINYLDANGQSRAYSYTADEDIADAAALVAALNKDSSVDAQTLKSAFDIKENNGKIEFTSVLADGATKTSKAGIVNVNTISGANTNALATAQTTIGKDQHYDVAVNPNSKFLVVDGKKYQLADQNSQIASDATALWVGNAGNITASDLSNVAAQLNSYGHSVEANGVDMNLSIYSKGNMGGALMFQIGANGGADQRVSLSINAMDSKSLGETSMEVEYTQVTGMNIASSSIATIEDANKAIDIIAGATNMVSTQRAELGALQNRLESTLNSLGVAKENLTAAESSIRDVDMAKEMMEFTKNNILIQASQAMLAQANQLPQGVLQLLR